MIQRVTSHQQLKSQKDEGTEKSSLNGLIVDGSRPETRRAIYGQGEL